MRPIRPLPGEYPYTRGIHRNGYRDRLWTMRQFAGFGNAAQTNERYHFLLEHGQHGLSVAFDMPTLMGYDSDAPQSRGEVGKCGVAIDSLADMEVLFDGIDMGDITTSMTINGPACIALAQYIAAAEKKGIPRAKLGGTIQADILKEYIAQKEWIFPPRPHMRIIVDMIEFCTREMPKWNTISISGYHIREAGSTAAQELAFTLADGFAYVEACDGRRHGRRLVRAAPFVLLQLAHRLLRRDRQVPRRAAHLRAPHAREVRRARIRARGSCAFTRRPRAAARPRSNPRTTSCALPSKRWRRCSAERSRCTPTRWTKCWRCRREKSVEIALRTQQVLAYETNVTNVVDPLGGSYFVEALTDEMERQAEAYFAQIDEYGGVIEAIEAGFFQREIAEASYRYQRSIETKDRIIVGVNAFVREDEKQPVDLLKITEETERAQARSVQVGTRNARSRPRRLRRWSACRRPAAIRKIT